LAILEKGSDGAWKREKKFCIPLRIDILESKSLQDLDENGLTTGRSPHRSQTVGKCHPLGISHQNEPLQSWWRQFWYFFLRQTGFDNFPIISHPIIKQGNAQWPWTWAFSLYVSKGSHPTAGLGFAATHSTEDPLFLRGIRRQSLSRAAALSIQADLLLPFY
jgi:hypothetical protein